MPQTRKNKIQVPLNSDAYNLVPDLTTMADTANVFPKVASASERNGLTSPVNGDKVVRTDLPGAPLETYNGTAWQEDWIDFGAPVALAGNWTVSGHFWGQRYGARIFVTGAVLIGRITSTLSLTGGGVSYTNLGQIIPSAACGTGGSFPSLQKLLFLSGNGASDLVEANINLGTGEILVRGYPGAVSWVAAANTTVDLSYVI